MAQQTQTRRILIKVDTSDAKGLREIADKMGMLNKNTKSLATNFGFLTGAVQTWIGYLGVREITRMSDEMQNLSNRLKITTKAGEDSTQVFEKIVGLADRTNQSLTATGDAYNRFAGALERTGANSDEVIALTETLINTFRVAGTTGQETANTMVQLGQAFSSGTLRGQELRSVLEQNRVLAGYLRQEYGESLFKKAEQGAIKMSDIVRILTKHQKELTEQAKTLTPTFDQSLTKAMNKFSIAIGQVNEQLGLSAKFYSVVAFAADHLGSILIILGAAMIQIAATYIPAIITALRALYSATLVFLKNPLYLAFAAIVAVSVLVYENFDKIKIGIERLRARFFDFLADMTEKFIPAMEKLDSVLCGKGFAERRRKENEKSVRDNRAFAAKLRKQADEEEKKNAAKKKAGDPASGLDTLLKKLQGGEGEGKLQKIKDILADINKELASGKIDVEEYNRKLVNFELYKLNREFKEGKFDVFTYNARLKELNIQEFNRLLQNGVLTFEQFNEAVRQANIDELNAKFKAGKISLADYNAELIKMSEKFEPGGALFVGVNNYITSVGTLSSNVANAITGVFTRLEDSLVEFTKTGEFNFSKFTLAILEDIQRIIIRMAILRPIAQSIANSFGGSAPAATGAADQNAYADYSGYAAKGMAFYGGVRKFAKGGLVNSPTAFTYNGGKRGLMGEAGTEAIMPLRRTSSGELGVIGNSAPVVVNVYNQSGAEVTQSESTGPNGERLVELLITAKVKEGISTGKFDSAFNQSYGLKRKGS